MYRLFALALVLLATSTTYAQLPAKPQTPTPTPLFREAFMPKSEVLLSYPMDAKLGGKPIWLWKYHKRQLSELSITNARGKKLTKEKIIKTLKKPTIVLVSPDGKPIHPYYLRIIKPETLVIIDKARQPPKDADAR